MANKAQTNFGAIFNKEIAKIPPKSKFKNQSSELPNLVQKLYPKFQARILKILGVKHF